MDTFVTRVRPLTCLKLDGRPYKRTDAVEALIAGLLCLPPSAWIVKKAELPAEVIVYLIREIWMRTMRHNKAAFGELCSELITRIVPIARSATRGFNFNTRDDILCRVEKAIFRLVFAETPSRKSEILEVAFGQAVKRRTLDEVDRHRRSEWGQTFSASVDDDEDFSELDRLIESVEDHRPGPEASLLIRESKEVLQKLYRRAKMAIEDPQDRKAVTLHICKGVPIESMDPKEKTVPTLLRETKGKVRYRLTRAVGQMRKALGLDNAKGELQ
jgi:hypothetical protein